MGRATLSFAARGLTAAMCYFVRIASPLTLSEVRSMLPAGIAAQPASGADTLLARRFLPAAQTVATLLVGACSCDLVRPRAPEPRDDERHLRERFARMGLPRGEIIRRLERHRRRPSAPPSGAPPLLLASFVAEHARNAGTTLYTLRFGDDSADPFPGGTALSRTVAEVRELPGGWLEEDRAVLVVR